MDISICMLQFFCSQMKEVKLPPNHPNMFVLVSIMNTVLEIERYVFYLIWMLKSANKYADTHLLLPLY